MSIKSDVIELESLKAEIKRLNSLKKGLHSKVKIVEKRIFDYLKSREQCGLKHQGTAIVLTEKQVTKCKKKKEGNDSAISILEKYGIKNPEKALNEIMDAKKMEPVKTEKLVIKKY
jgi:hypothetical protein